MTDASEGAQEVEQGVIDPCGEFGPAQRSAVVWFVVTLIGGVLLTARLSGIDAWMYATNAQVLDFEKYKENRAAFTSLASERSDPRSRGDIGSAEHYSSQ